MWAWKIRAFPHNVIYSYWLTAIQTDGTEEWEGLEGIGERKVEIDENCIQRMGEILKEEGEKLKEWKEGENWKEVKRREMERDEKGRNNEMKRGENVRWEDEREIER